MSKIASLAKRLDTLARQAWPPEQTRAFILLGNADLSPGQRTSIGPGDTLYIKRIVLTHA